MLWHGGSFGAGSITRQQVLDAVWGDFGEPDVQRYDGTALGYYRNWTTRAGTTQSLLATADGMCGAWAEFFHNILMAQGLGRAPAQGVAGPTVDYDNLRLPFSTYVSEVFLVANWAFGQSNIPGGQIVDTKNELARNP